QAEEYDGCGSQNDTDGNLDGVNAERVGVVGAQEDGNTDTCKPAEEDGNAAEISDGLGVDLAFAVGVIDHTVSMGQCPHEGGKDKGSEKRDAENGHVRLDHGRKGITGNGSVCHDLP